MSNYDSIMDGTTTKPLFEKSDADCSTFINAAIPRTYLTTGTAQLPSSIVALMSGPGGSSKSMCVLGIALSLVSGKTYLGFIPEGQKEVIYLSGEDDKSEIHRRAERMFPELFPSQDNSPFDKKAALAALNRFHVPDLTGQNLRLSEKSDDISKTKVFQSLVIALEPFENLDMIIFDTGSRFRGGTENSAEDAAFFITLCEQVVSEKEATVLVITHSNKLGGSNQQSVRGSSAIVDNARFVMTMKPNNDDQTLIEFNVAKNNYGLIGKQGLFRRKDDGTLELTDQNDAQKTKALAKLGIHEQSIIDHIRSLHSAGAPISIRDFARNYSGTKASYDLSENTLREGLLALVDMGRLTKQKSGRTEILVPVVQVKK